MKRKAKRKPRGKAKSIASQTTQLAEAIRFLQEFGDADDAPMMKALRDVEDSWVCPELLKAAKRGELAEVVRAIKRLPKETDSRRHVHLAHIALCYGLPPFPTFPALMQKLHERADGKTGCVPPERTVRYIVETLRLPMADSKTGRRFAKKRLN